MSINKREWRWGYEGKVDHESGKLTITKVLKRWTGSGWEVIKNPADGASEGGVFNEFGEVTP